MKKILESKNGNFYKPLIETFFERDPEFEDYLNKTNVRFLDDAEYPDQPIFIGLDLTKVRLEDD